MTDAKAHGAQRLDLPKAVQQLLEECRMVLPGIQALFGFQLVAVLSSGFPQLSIGLKRLHLAATVLTTVAIALVLAPAAYHRRAYPRSVSETLLRVSSQLLVASMWPLAIGICLELYVVAYVVTEQSWVAAISALLFVLFVTLWFIVPGARRRRRHAQESERQSA